MLAGALLLGVLGTWLFLRDDGFIEQVTAARVESVLIDNRVPAPMAECMAPELADRLDWEQLEKLERLAPRDGETMVPLSMPEALRRLRRVDDADALEQLVRVAGGCGFDLMLERF